MAPILRVLQLQASSLSRLASHAVGRGNQFKDDNLIIRASDLTALASVDMTKKCWIIPERLPRDLA
jgi:hypothetical protein